MERSILVAGFGGQGVMTLGQLICYTASDTTDKNVTYFPSYGSEQRGGTANCYVVVSDDNVGAPVTDKVDDLIVMNDPSLAKFTPKVKEGGVIFVNSSIVTSECQRKDVKIVEVPANDLATELGSTKIANVLMVGAYIGYTELLPEENVLATVLKKLARKAEFVDMNKAAFAKGLEIGRAAR